MTAGWYASIPHSGSAHTSPLRRTLGIEVLDEGGDRVWLRGPHLEDETRGALRAILDCRLYCPLGDGQLAPLGRTLPQGYEPDGQWKPLREWLVTTPPPPRFAVRSVERISPTLVRGGRQEEPSLICVTRTDWLSYASTAPLARLTRLTFAVSSAGAAILGRPLPPLNGRFYWVRSGIAAPVGYSWRPAVDPSVLRALFQLAEGDLAILLRGGGCSVIRGDQFVGASRSAARLSEGVGRGES